MLRGILDLVQRLRPCWLLAIIVLQGLAAQDQEDSNNQAFRSIRGPYFEVVGLDYASVSAVNQLAEKVAETCGQYMSKLEHSYPRRIMVALRPMHSTQEGADYIVRQGEAGFFRVDFRWGPQLEMETVCRGLTEAFVKRYAHSHYGPKAPQHIKYWPISALAAQTYLNLRPSQIASYIEELSGASLPDLTALIALPYGEAIQQGTGREGYWVLNCLRRDGRKIRDISRMMEMAIAGLDVTAKLELLIQPLSLDVAAITLQNWWDSQIAELFQRDHEVYESMEVSLTWIEQIADFDAYRSKGHAFKNLRDLWGLRHEAEMREILTARRDLIGLRMARVNPVYYNTAHSLALLYDAVLEGRRNHEFIFALTKFLSDLEDMKRLHRLTMQILDQR